MAESTAFTYSIRLNKYDSMPVQPQADSLHDFAQDVLTRSFSEPDALQQAEAWLNFVTGAPA